MCCIGCQAVAQTIVDNNLTQYYQFRTEPAQKGTELIPEELKTQQRQKNKLLDEEVLQSEFIYQDSDSKENRSPIQKWKKALMLIHHLK